MKNLSRAEKIELATALHVRDLRQERKRQSSPGGLIHFIRYFWHVLEPNQPFTDGWPLWAMCKHLEAVARGEITRLLINIPPGSTKSMLVNVFFPAWEWSAFGRPDHRYLSFSYGSYLTERDNQRMLMLLDSREFKELWGSKFSMVTKGSIKFSNNHRGWKYATSVGGVSTGERGSRILADDLHNIADGESQKIRESTCQWYREAMSNRLNDMETSAIIVVMQRVAEDDVAGLILSGDVGEYVHLCIPMEYEAGRHCTTYVNGKEFWTDPRTVEGENFWPERFPPEAVKLCKAQGPYAWASQYAQRPEIRGGGLIKREYWQTWDPVDGKWPLCDFVLASLDPAFTSKEENDPSGFTVWGTFLAEDGSRAAILLYAFRKHLELHGPEVEKWPGETDADFRQRCGPSWGLVETVADACKRFKVNHLLIEAKASGHSVAQEMGRLHANHGFSVELVDPHGLDKTARVIRVQPVFSGEQVYAPDRSWAQMVIDECALFPRGRYDDLCDSSSQALFWLRTNGFLDRRSEQFADNVVRMKKYKQETALYPV